MKIRIAILDDNRFLLKALEEKVSLFNDLEHRISLVSGEVLLQKLQENLNVDLVLMDIEMPGLNGIDTTMLVKQKFPHIKIIMLTVFDNDEYIFNAIKAGADGYFLKDTNPEDLHRGIINTMNGGAGMTPSIAKKTLKLLRNPEAVTQLAYQEEISLSSREIEVLEYLCTGLSHTLIAERLFLSPNTVRKHIENIYKKLQVHSKIEAVEKARRHNLI
ncbi:response regulator transcription factor [uncultured Christiangramia sp.]|uniref:response regulator n=1 Tax=uncultured Christiangramia sp. TaxID=503836 RepID=UPI0025EFBFD8|nr:response regulator transcription factor [uncultured Christiangramia sp.]|tara:strand:+ start:3231 stop:3881 length:651 start_codon:yes stop_codon:yes gene_type:complete